TYDDAVFNLGILLERKRLPEEAIEAFLLVAKQPGRQGDLALFAAGRLYVQLGEKENAKKVLESFLNRWKGEGAVRQNAERLLRQLNID
ncbi:MAG: tetratricopeptide repeat protein, partial [Candidatus Latescibacteria bacterium]|nr:tetratricopeptide repeat protein [Candidatus Latescibacterota bacterium]